MRISDLPSRKELQSRIDSKLSSGPLTQADLRKNLKEFIKTSPNSIETKDQELISNVLKRIYFLGVCSAINGILAIKIGRSYKSYFWKASYLKKVLIRSLVSGGPIILLYQYTTDLNERLSLYIEDKYSGYAQGQLITKDSKLINSKD
jgi:hypothetical protein